MIYGITLIFLGLLAIPSLIISKKPEAQALFDKIAPYQGIIGIIFAVLGLWGIISCLLHTAWLSLIPVAWFIWLLASVVEASLGFILGYGLISKHLLSKNEAAKEKGDQLLQKLLPLQGKLGLVAIVLGVIQVIASIMYNAAV